MHPTELYGLSFEECVERLKKYSEAYAESILYARFSYSHNIHQIKIAVENSRK
jgi:hypothetical protein